MKVYRKVKNQKVSAIINAEMKRQRIRGDFAAISLLKIISKKYY